MKLFNNHSGLRGLAHFAKGIYWAAGLSLTTPFTEGCPGANNKASPPGRHQEQAPKQRCTFSPTTFSSVQMASLGIILFLRSLYSKFRWRPRHGTCMQRYSPLNHIDYYYGVVSENEYVLSYTYRTIFEMLLKQRKVCKGMRNNNSVLRCGWRRRAVPGFEECGCHRVC